MALANEFGDPRGDVVAARDGSSPPSQNVGCTSTTINARRSLMQVG